MGIKKRCMNDIKSVFLVSRVKEQDTNCTVLSPFVNELPEEGRAVAGAWRDKFLELVDRE
ncbi:hypothetical protein [Sporosarcina psychrophila]|uniref:Uncharacterized protein n=1 Tax=Sporosarcina psychrophila TaxID=1476 RepID=A0ABV2KDA4_SPOPS